MDLQFTGASDTPPESAVRQQPLGPPMWAMPALHGASVVSGSAHPGAASRGPCRPSWCRPGEMPASCQLPCPVSCTALLLLVPTGEPSPLQPAATTEPSGQSSCLWIWAAPSLLHSPPCGRHGRGSSPANCVCCPKPRVPFRTCHSCPHSVTHLILPMRSEAGNEWMPGWGPTWMGKVCESTQVCWGVVLGRDARACQGAQVGCTP